MDGLRSRIAGIEDSQSSRPLGWALLRRFILERSAFIIHRRTGKAGYLPKEAVDSLRSNASYP